MRNYTKRRPIRQPAKFVIDLSPPSETENSTDKPQGASADNVAELPANGEPVEARMNSKVKLMMAGLTLSTTALFIRAVYRTIEVRF